MVVAAYRKAREYLALVWYISSLEVTSKMFFFLSKLASVQIRADPKLIIFFNQKIPKIGIFLANFIMIDINIATINYISNSIIKTVKSLSDTVKSPNSWGKGAEQNFDGK